MATFSGALAWPFVYPWPQRPAGLIEAAFDELARRWRPILDVAEENGVDVCYEIHPGEDLFDGTTFERFLDQVDGHARCNMLYDPSHYVLQCLDYLDHIDIYHERISMFHVKDAEFNPTGRQGVYSGYAGWVERAGPLPLPGDGQVDFGAVFSKLTAYDFDGWAVVEWECALKHPEDGAREGAEFVQAPHHPRDREGLRRLRRRRHRRGGEPPHPRARLSAMKAGFCMLLWTTHVTEEHLRPSRADQGGGLRRRRGADLRGRARALRLARRQARRRGAGGDRGRADARRGAQPDLGRPRRAARRRAHLDWLSTAPTRSAPRRSAGPSTRRSASFTGRGPTEDELGAARRGAPGDGRPRAGLTLAIEPLNRFECYVLTTNAQAAAHVATVGRPNFGYLYDTFHSNIEERDPVGADRRDDRARSATSTSRRTTAARPGTGHIDHAAAIRAARDAGYDGWFTIEAFGQALPDLAAATRVWRPLFDERGRGGEGRRAGDPRRLGELTTRERRHERDETRPHPAGHGRRRQGRLHRRGAPHRGADRRRLRAGGGRA